MASPEDAIRSAVPGGIAKPLMLALLALLASGALFGGGGKESSAKAPNRHQTREPRACSEDWAGCLINCRRVGWAMWRSPGLVLAKISRSRLVSLVRPLAPTS